ncbi:MAG: hypothetical protein GEU93_01580 [Propionibacteriales bacterium]|nr:hypothetical protein [Propionibacteriales bacterium]
MASHAAGLMLPLWTPWPLPSGWQVAGHGHVGDPANGRATVFACRGPNPVGGEDAELLVVAEEPGTGLGSRLAGLSSPDPGPEFGFGMPQAKVLITGRPTSLWWVSSAAPDRAVYAGEAAGRWIWLILHPESAGALLMEELSLADVRDLGLEVELLKYGDLSPRLQLADDGDD